MTTADWRIRVEQLPVEVYPNPQAMGAAVAHVAAETLMAAVAARGEANLILATGNSQLPFLAALRGLPDIEWSAIKVFHMDEYLGIDPAHPASFPRYLHQNIIDYVNPGAFYPIPGRPEDVEAACAEYERLLRAHPADLVALGFGENGHLAFNDPPYADFADPVWVKVVALAARSRQQQVDEGHFSMLDDVPREAITLTIPALLAAKRILAIVPEARKADAVHDCLTLPVDENRPGSVLRRVKHATLYLDPDSAARIQHLRQR